MTQTQLCIEPLTFTVDVGFTTQRPVIPDQHTSRVVLVAYTEAEAHTTAALMVASRPCVVMPTRTTTVAVEI